MASDTTNARLNRGPSSWGLAPIAYDGTRTPEKTVLFILLCVAWLLPGLVGHDPWKPDEAYTFGVGYEMIQGGSWVAPALAGEPFLKEPPLYYLTAAASALLFSPILPLHDGARL